MLPSETRTRELDLPQDCRPNRERPASVPGACRTRRNMVTRSVNRPGGPALSQGHAKFAHLERNACAMPNLTEVLTAESKKNAVADDCVALIDAEVSDKGGLTGLAIKAGYKTVQGFKPGFVRQVVVDLLPEFAKALEPMFEEARGGGIGVRAHFDSNAPRVADALLSITDEKAKRSKSGMVKGTYEKLRGSAKKNAEPAVPRLSAMIEKHAS